eukprot:s4100_g8.t1
MVLHADGAASAGDETFTGKADSFVPTFFGKQSDYKEFRRRCDIYAAKMRLAKRENETVFNIVTLLKGQAWDCLEDLGIEDLAKETAYKTVFDRLDKFFKFDPLTELPSPSDFEAYFIKLQRKTGQTVQQYQTEYKGAWPQCISWTFPRRRTTTLTLTTSWSYTDAIYDVEECPVTENKGKSSGKGGKSSGKGKGKPFGKSPLRKGIQHRGQAALGKSLCLRCGQARHRARDCPAGASDTKKRKTENAAVDADVHMVADTELYAADYNHPNDCAVQDGGAASVLGSAKSICNYIDFMQNHGIDVDNEVDVFACEKGFRYGNSQREVTNLCCLLPTFIGGQKQKILCYVIQGEAPILIGRPLMKKLNIVVDYATDCYCLAATSGDLWTWGRRVSISST